MSRARCNVLVCTGGGCVASGALELSAAFRAAIVKHGLGGEVQVIETGCLGPCAAGPVAAVYPDGILYQNLKVEDAERIAEEHLLKGRIVKELAYQKRADDLEGAWTSAPGLQEIPFFRKQVKIVLRNCGLIDPLKIEEYIARDGYMALAKVLTGMSPEQVIDEVKHSGLRGRGGAGFSTGMKWELTRKASGTEKYVLCNADEGDPGAFMDRSVLEGDPHSLIEAMSIAGHAVGSSQGYVYVRAEYPLAVARLTKALEQARALGLLGRNIMGTKFSFDLEIRMGSGAFVCGEETALMTSIEGNRGEPRPRPPFPANKGLWNKPSLLNNVETYAAVPVIILKGAPWYASMGTAKSKGTKVFALAGAVQNTGLVEIPIGMPLGEIIYDIGGGMRAGKTYKAAQIGGPSGGCIPRHHLNVPVDYESLNELGAIMGSGGLIVMDDDTCMVDIARFFLDFVQDESCGKCTPCRIGTKRMLEILNRICEGRGEEGDIERLIDLGTTIKDTALCGLGQTAPNPVLSAIRHFREEFVEHIRDKKCRAGVCPELVRAPCQNACPAGVDVPGFISLTAEKRYAEALALHREKNPFVAVCARVCFHPCEGKCRRSTLDDPLSIRSIKRFLSDQEDGFKLPASIADPANAKRKVAVIGAGPAGLSCAYFLARLGYTPVVFEAADKPGGMLVQAIPAYRLPRDVLSREIRMIREMGVQIKTGQRLGKDFTLTSLKDKGFEAVFLAVGAPNGMGLGMKGEDARGVVEAIEFLKSYNLTGKAPVGKNVLVVGGGNAAVDAARTALRLGAKSVTVAYRRTRAEMPAYAEEVEEAEREGVCFELLAAPAELVVEQGKLKGVKLTRMELGEFDRTGRRKPVAGRESRFLVEADQLIAAVGQTLNSAELFDGTAVKLTEREYVAVDPVTGRTSVEWVFAGGDAASGPASVVEAIAAGEKAAVGIDGYLKGAARPSWRTDHAVDTSFDPDADPVLTPRAEMKLLPVSRRIGGFTEVETTWVRATALSEAKRCLRCDWREENGCPAGAEAGEKTNGGAVRGRGLESLTERSDDMPTLTIDNRKIQVPEGTNLLEAARAAGVHVPSLCYLKDVQAVGSCRVCLVEVKGARTLMASCVTPAGEGMEVQTNSPRVRKARRAVVELILSDHEGDCQTCDRNGDCELQALAGDLGIREITYAGAKSGRAMDASTPALVRDTAKCVLCRRCVTVCGQTQGVAAIFPQRRGFASVIGPAFASNLSEVVCVQCGQCAAVCPVGAIGERDEISKVWAAIDDPSKTVLVQTAPAIRAALGECFGSPPGTLVTGKMVSALRQMGFDRVFDTNFTADLTILEEGTELLTRLKNVLVDGGKAALPMFTSCSPGWIRYAEHFWPDMLANISTCKSPQQMFGAVAKTWYAQKIGKKPEDVFVVSVMPCTAKKYESQRPEMTASGVRDVDVVLTTRELGRMITQAGIEFSSLPDGAMDSILGASSGAADIFANTGGVMEAALRTVYEIVTGRELPFENLHVTPIAGLKGIKEASVKIEGAVPDWSFLEGVTVKVAVAHGLGNARMLIERIKGGETYHFVEVMTCPGGCIGGGGQPRMTTDEVRLARISAIYKEDEGKPIRKSHRNPEVTAIYEEFLKKPLGEKSHHLLHTKYTARARV